MLHFPTCCRRAQWVWSERRWKLWLASRKNLQSVKHNSRYSTCLQTDSSLDISKSLQNSHPFLKKTITCFYYIMTYILHIYWYLQYLNAVEKVWKMINGECPGCWLVADFSTKEATRLNSPFICCCCCCCDSTSQSLSSPPNSILPR